MQIELGLQTRGGSRGCPSADGLILLEERRKSHLLTAVVIREWRKFVTALLRHGREM